MCSFVLILIYLLVLSSQLMLRCSFDLDSHTTFVRTVRLYVSLRMQGKHGLKDKLPCALLNESIHSSHNNTIDFTQ